MGDWHIDQRDIARYRKLLKEKAAKGEAPTGMDIAGSGTTRSTRRTIAFVLVVLVVAAIFTVLFMQFTSNLRVALVIVAAMLAYMIVMARMAEGRFDPRN
jgi:Flp pilus assembly protein TadB